MKIHKFVLYIYRLLRLKHFQWWKTNRVRQRSRCLCKQQDHIDTGSWHLKPSFEIAALDLDSSLQSKCTALQLLHLHSSSTASGEGALRPDYVAKWLLQRVRQEGFYRLTDGGKNSHILPTVNKFCNVLLRELQIPAFQNVWNEIKSMKMMSDVLVQSIWSASTSSSSRPC